VTLSLALDEDLSLIGDLAMNASI